LQPLLQPLDPPRRRKALPQSPQLLLKGDGTNNNKFNAYWATMRLAVFDLDFAYLAPEMYQLTEH
jgi:hypothetical protein